MKKEKPIYISLGLLIAILFSLEIDLREEKCNKAKVSQLQGLIVHTSANIYLTNSEEESLKIEGEQELIDRLVMREEDHNLVIELKRIYNPIEIFKLAFKEEQKLNIYISGPQANELEVKNESEFNVCSFYESQDAKVLELKNQSIFNLYREASCSKTSLSAVILRHLQSLT